MAKKPRENQAPRRASAPGKVILLGEHAVVYGYPALAGALDRGTEVELFPSVHRELVADWVDDNLLLALDLLPQGLGVRIRSLLPVGRGLGSSAALSVALTRAAWPGLGPEEVARRALDFERVFHGNPSGLDTTVAAHGGLFRFQRGLPPSLTPVTPPAPLRLLVLDSGVAGPTAAMVEGVRSRKPGVDKALQAIGEATDRALPVLGDLLALGALFDEQHALLAEIGVSTPRLDELVVEARRAGALGAKLSGAGGGGVAIALVPPGEPVLERLEERGIPAFEVRIP